MNSFIGTYRNLIGQQLTGFKIIELAGRDSSGAPAFKVECDKCSFPQTLPYQKLAPLVDSKTQQSLFCANFACPQSHHSSESETFSEFRRRDRKEIEQAVREAEQAQKLSDAQAAKAQQEALRLHLIQKQFSRLWSHQLRNGVDQKAICSRERWFALGDDNRALVLAAMAENPGKEIRF